MGNGDIRVKEAIRGLGLYIGLVIMAYKRGSAFGRILQGKFGIQIYRFVIFKANIIWKVECIFRVNI